MTAGTRCRGERGQLAGVETLPFGVLVFVAGTMLAINVWAVVDMRGAVDASARNYLRAYTSAGDRNAAEAAGADAALSTLRSHGIAPSATAITSPTGAFGPCELVEVTVSVEHRAIRVPFIGHIGASTTTATQRELMQPFGTPALRSHSDPLAGTPCDD